MFYTQTGAPGIGKLIIDNFAKNPYIYKPSSTSEEFDVLTHGKIFMPLATTKYRAINKISVLIASASK